jgi:GntR family transcriptional regulator, transcriptional repressor for pyruvate dehydrogenase complex
MAAEPAISESGPRRRAVRLAPLQVPKAPEILADELRKRILRGDFPEGTALPPERELVTQTQMSRATIREALRILEVQGLVRIKTGRAGGAYVSRPGQDSMAESVDLLIRARRIRIPALLEAREAIEPFCAQLAAKHRTDEDLGRLEAANVAMAAAGTLAEFLQANVDWHVAVAVAGQNELLTGFMRALSRAIYAATDNQGFVDDDVRQTTLRAHRTVTKAIQAKDPEAARRRMSRHVHSYAEAVMEVEDRTAIEVPEN